MAGKSSWLLTHIKSNQLQHRSFLKDYAVAAAKRLFFPLIPCVHSAIWWDHSRWWMPWFIKVVAPDKTSHIQLSLGTINLVSIAITHWCTEHAWGCRWPVVNWIRAHPGDQPGDWAETRLVWAFKTSLQQGRVSHILLSTRGFPCLGAPSCCPFFSTYIWGH